MYEIDETTLAETCSNARPGTNLLIKGPPMVGKRDLALELLAAGFDAGDGVLCIATDDSAASLADAFARYEGSFDSDRMGIVGCSRRTSARPTGGIITESVSSPSDLTGISIATVKIMRSFSERNVSSVRHGVLSVSTLSQYLDTRSVFKFLHVYTARIRDTDGLGVFTLNSAAEESTVVNTLSSEFDGIIELRETDDGDREVRLTGIPGASGTWRPY